MTNSWKGDVNRRNFLKVAAAGVAATVAPPAASAQEAAPAPGSAIPPLSQAAETQTPSDVEVLTDQHPGSDYMVDVIKSLGFEYICVHPGSTFRALHESIINYGGNRSPELITCTHEELSVAMCHGYAKVEGKPLAAMLHGPVGLQHASMAIYNAYCDRAPVFSSSAISWMLPSGAPGSSGPTPARTLGPSCATASSGMTLPFRCSTSPSRQFAPTRLQ